MRLISRILSALDKDSHAECVICKNRIATDDFLFTDRGLGVCRYCHEHLPFVPVGQMFTGRKYIDYSMSVFYYLNPLRELMIDYKFHDCAGYGRIFGYYMLELAAAIYSGDYDFDMVVPVPLSAERYAERGYNQAEILSDYIAAQLGIMHSDKALFRTRNTKRQSGLDATERATNLIGAFTADWSIVNGRRILLIDDIYTSGNTAEECAKALKKAGAEVVIVFTFARKYSSTKSREYRELFGI